MQKVEFRVMGWRVNVPVLWPVAFDRLTPYLTRCLMCL